jgi:DNA modification methylase
MALPSNSLSIELLEIASLRSALKNVRRHSRKQVPKLQKSLNHFGQPRPILVTPDHEIIDGHLVCEALKANGATTVRAIVVRGLSPIEIRALRLMLHRSAEDAVWDLDAVRIELQAILDAGLDLDLTGFETPELDQILQADIPRANVGEDGGDIPRAGASAISRPGDIWQCGRHRIGCGNARDQRFVARVREGRLVNVSFIDPPYNLPIAGFVSGKGRHQHREFLQGSGEMSSDDFFALLRDSLEVLRTASTADAVVFGCIDWRHVVELVVAGRVCGMALYNLCVWVKNNPGMGGIYRNQHELVAVFRAGTGQPVNNVELGKYGRNRSNVWSYPGMASFGAGRDELLASHPTVKPIALISDVLRDVTKRGDVVLDTFLGSGSTLMAAQETGRICFGVELDPLYVDAAIRRWQRATGLDAVHAESGQTFEQSASHALSLPTGPSS